MLILRGDAQIREIVDLLEESGVTPVWSAFSQTVYLTDFVTTRRVPLAEALRRILPDDPRRTPWLDRLGDFYHATDGSSDWSLLYIPASKSARARRILSRGGGTQDWLYRPQNNPVLFGLLWVPGVCLAAFFAARSRRALYFILAAVIPWLPLWFSNRPATVLAGLWGYLTLVTLGTENEREPGRILPNLSRESIIRALPGGIVFLLLCASDIRSLPGGLISAFSAACLAAGLEFLYRRRVDRSIHMVFNGPILDSLRLGQNRDERWVRRTIAVLAAAGVVLIGQGILPALGASPEAAGKGIPSLPVPGAPAASGTLDSEAVERIIRQRPALAMPNLADAVAHRAYQEALPYTRIGTRVYGSLEPVVIEHLRPEGATVVKTSETAVEFGDAWVRSAAREEAGEGIGSVLGAQRGIAKVELQAADRLRSPQSLALNDVFFYIILLAPVGWGLGRNKRWRLAFTTMLSAGAARR